MSERNLLNEKLLWLLQKLYKQRLTLEEILTEYQYSSISDGKPIAKQTFFNLKNDAAQLLAVRIVQEKGGERRYYIENPEDLPNLRTINDVEYRRWALEASLPKVVKRNLGHILDRVDLGDVPSAEQFFETILLAIKMNRRVEILYQSFWSQQAEWHELMPYGVKLHNSRWYLLARYADDSDFYVFGLDRIQEANLLDKEYKIPADFNCREFFRPFYGTYVTSNPPQAIRLRIANCYINYLITLPLHHTQRIVNHTDRYTDLEVTVPVTPDFINAVMKMGSDAEVLSPPDFRRKIAAIVDHLHSLYRK